MTANEGTICSLQEWLNVVLVATTCNPDAVDEALLRPGRFDLIVYVPPPDAQVSAQTLLLFSNHLGTFSSY